MTMTYEIFTQRLHQQLGLDFTGYRETQIQRRIGTYMQRKGILDYVGLLRHLGENPLEVGEMRDYLAINVSEFFRNPELFQYLNDHVFPGFIRSGNMNIWSAGCSVGCEAYTLGILANEHLPKGSWSIQGTDIDGEALSAANAGTYAPDFLKALPEKFLSKYFVTTAEGKYAVKDSLKSKVRFKRHDLLKDPCPAGQDLILCRNVVIYFTEEAKNDIFIRMARALRPGGILFIGATESFHAYREHQLTRLHPCFFQKV